MQDEQLAHKRPLLAAVLRGTDFLTQSNMVQTFSEVLGSRASKQSEDMRVQQGLADFIKSFPVNGNQEMHTHAQIITY